MREYEFRLPKQKPKTEPPLIEYLDEKRLKQIESEYELERDFAQSTPPDYVPELIATVRALWAQMQADSYDESMD